MTKLAIASLLLFCGTNNVLSFAPRVQPSACNRVAVGMSSAGKSPMSDMNLPDMKMPDINMPDVSDIVDKVAKLDVGQVVSNLQSGGEVGKRGEVYVIGQFALIFFILIGGVPFIGDPLKAISGPVLLLGGVALAVLGVSDLESDSLTPFLKPTDNGSLKEDGIYASIRHPIYAGLISIMAGLSIVSDSADRLFLTAALYALIDVKASMEEEYLMDRYPGYEEYMEKIPGKFFPAGLLDDLKLGE